MQNKAEAQPAWLQLAAGAYLSLTIFSEASVIMAVEDILLIRKSSIRGMFYFCQVQLLPFCT